MTSKHEASDPTPRAGSEAASEAEPDNASDAPSGSRPGPVPDDDPGVEAGAPEVGESHGAGGGGGAGKDNGSDDNGGIQGTAGDDSETGKEAIDLSEIASFLSGSDELKGIAAERDEYLDSLRRLQADFDNYRKRAIRQQTELVERATEGLLVRLLPVLDALDLAMAHLPAAGEGTDSDAMRSLTQIGTLLRDILEREGLERIDQVGVRFDPTIHDAVAQAGPAEAGSREPLGQSTGDQDDELEAAPEEAGPGSSGDNSVASVMRSGYRLKGRVLRPAMVAVRG
jgi:molecular chaperone GrpE